MAISSLKEAGREISRLQKLNQAQADRINGLEAENAGLRDQLALTTGTKSNKKADKATE